MNKAKWTIVMIIFTLAVVAGTVMIIKRDNKVSKREISDEKLQDIREQFGEDAFINSSEGFIVEFKDGHITNIYENTRNGN